MFAAAPIRISNTTIANPYQARAHLPTAVEIYCKWHARPAGTVAFLRQAPAGRAINFFRLAATRFSGKKFPLPILVIVRFMTKFDRYPPWESGGEGATAKKQRTGEWRMSNCEGRSTDLGFRLFTSSFCGSPFVRFVGSLFLPPINSTSAAWLVSSPSVVAAFRPGWWLDPVRRGRPGPAGPAMCLRR